MTLPSPDEPRALLAALEARANKRFGQHFLARPDTVRRIVRASGVRAGDRVVEIGPGLGILTQVLRETGVDLTVVEIDKTLAGVLRERWPDLDVRETDATTVSWDEIVPGGAAHLVANLPYNVGTGIVMDAARAGAFATMTVMLQSEVCDRMAAAPGSKAYAALSLALQARAEVRHVLDVPPGAFVPPPKVHSAVVHIVRRDTPDFGPAGEGLFDRTVRAAFAARRKTLRNALGAAFGYERAEAALAEAGVDPGLRAEVLGAEAFRAIAAAFSRPIATTEAAP